MNKLLWAATGLSVSMLSAPAALADYRGYRGDNGYDRYDARAERTTRTYARVIDAQPIYRSVSVNRPHQECWDQRVVYNDPRRDNNIAAGGLIGAVAGGVLGHQFGGGSGRAVATAVGAVIGANVGANTAAANTPSYQRTGYEQRCRTVSESYVEDRVEGYDVSYKYQGRVYHTRMPYDPGDRIAIDVDVRPVAY